MRMDKEKQQAKRDKKQWSHQNTDTQQCFSMPCLFVLISYQFKLLMHRNLNKLRTNWSSVKQPK